jgi:hypothetical protein
VTRTIWLASYPKSGNTWLRMPIANLSATGGPADINDLPERGVVGAVVIVRDPRDVAPSLVNHMRINIDAAIDFMRNGHAGFGVATDPQSSRLRQRLPGSSGHVASARVG